VIDGDDLLEEDEPSDDDVSEAREGRRGSPTPPAPTPPDLTERLTRLRGAIRPKRIAAFDIETQEWDWPYACGFYEASLKDVQIWTSRRNRPREWPYKKQEPDCIDQFLEFFLQPQFAGVTCYAHNGGNFDFIPILERCFVDKAFATRGFQLQLASIQSCLYRMEFTHPKHKGRWVLLDSTRTLPMTLDQAAEAFVGKKKVDLAALLGVKPYRLYRELSRVRNTPVLKKYLKRDVLLLYYTMKNFQKLVNDEGGNLKATIGSTAMDLFRRKYLRKSVYINRHLASCPDIPTGGCTCQGCGHRRYKACLCGGRTEILQLEGRDLLYYDVNGMYPWTMTLPMPTGIATELHAGRGEDVLAQARSMIGIIECDVEIPADCYLPPLPLHTIIGSDGKATPVGPYGNRQGAKLTFPTGRFRGVWDTAELALLPEVGGKITAVHHQIWHTAEPIFAPYVSRFYGEYRDKSDPAWTPGRSEFGKRMGNHLYGKFGQGELQEELYLDPPSDMIGELQLWSTIRMGLFWRWAQHKPEHVAPQLAVHITSLARARLWRILRSVVDLGGEIHYCDTDSVVCKFPPGVQPWPSESHLGGLKLEHRLRRAKFVLPKLYLTDCTDDCPCGWQAKGRQRRQVKAKGMGPGLGRKLTAAAWERITDLSEPPEERQWKRRQIAKWKTAIDLFQRDQLRFFQVIKTTKAIRSTYDKRRVVSDGPQTVPLLLQPS
jgi:hypothetical protein